MGETKLFILTNLEYEMYEWVEIVFEDIFTEQNFEYQTPIQLMKKAKQVMGNMLKKLMEGISVDILVVWFNEYDQIRKLVNVCNPSNAFIPITYYLLTKTYLKKLKLLKTIYPNAEIYESTCHKPKALFTEITNNDNVIPRLNRLRLEYFYAFSCYEYLNFNVVCDLMKPKIYD